LNESTTANNRKVAFIARIENSRKIAAFCGKMGLSVLPGEIFTFKPGKIYGK